MSVYRIYVEKKEKFDFYSKELLYDIEKSLGITGINRFRVVNCYDIEGVNEDTLQKIENLIFYDPQTDEKYYELPQSKFKFAVEYLPGQYDQRADSCEQLIQIITSLDKPIVKTSKIYLIDGNLTDNDMLKIKNYIINPIESRETSTDKKLKLDFKYENPGDVPILDGFISYDKDSLNNFLNKFGLAMDLDDILFCQNYFKNTEKRDPTLAEIKMIDTYWSDHCRHTTFLTNLNDIDIENDDVSKAFELYKNMKAELGRDNKPITLMDIATIGQRFLSKKGYLKNLDISEEINACSIKIKVDVGSKTEDWLLMFKNETHNHPTEIEPFGGAATCLGGAIRDPLSGRSYVYQAMRVTGASNPLLDYKDTIKGKLPQKKIVTISANGYSSYGNQIGLATGLVKEIYHDGYTAKRLETGAVIAAAPAQNVIREVPSPGDVVILVGGKTGRDGCGGATGSSKAHTLDSLKECGAEVQKGNPLEERKIQRLFKNPNVSKLIKRCNDFGAGGVSVAVGELADGLIINLDSIPKKYEGLDGVELAISESQERMAVVVDKKNAEKFINEAKEENLLATIIAQVVETPRLIAKWRNKEIINLSREFLNSSGAKKFANILVENSSINYVYDRNNNQSGWEKHLGDLSLASTKGLSEQFDSTIGGATVLMPFGGKYQSTESQVMAAKIPVQCETKTVSLMSFGFNPYISEMNPFYGAQYAIIESISKIIAAGGKLKNCYLSLQEYFERLRDDKKRWGKPFSSLLGALVAQNELKIAAIGGKDSMSGSFEDLDVPPTLISFAVSTTSSDNVISTEFKSVNNPVGLILPNYKYGCSPNYADILRCFDLVEKLIEDKKIISAWAISTGSISEAISKMSFGNKIGFKFDKEIDNNLLFNPIYGGFIVELAENVEGVNVLGHTIKDYKIVYNNEEIDINSIENKHTSKLESVYKTKTSTINEKPIIKTYNSTSISRSKIKYAKPRVLLSVFPGTNCEFDTQRQFSKAGAIVDSFVIKNLNRNDIKNSINEFLKLLENSQILMIPGGFSGGDEPDGSAKFISAFFRHPALTNAIDDLLYRRDGLILGICNGFQALVKLGLLPFGKIVEPTINSPILAHNTIGRHQSKIVTTKIISNKSPWLANTKVCDIHKIAISHGEGRFIANDDILNELIENGQIATQYVDLDGNPTYDIDYNPNGSVLAIEGITSKDGRILGKMGHSERIGDNVYKNIEGLKDQKLFVSGVEYFS